MAQQARDHNSQQTHIVIVDDDMVVRSLISGYLASEFSNLSEAANAKELERILVTAPVDLVLLDIVLPDKDGFVVTRELRNKSNVGIILISKKNDDYDRILGLELGADDYISKPFIPRELLARVKTVLRRVKNSNEPNDLSSIVRFDDWRLDLNTRILSDSKGSPIKLTSGEFIILSNFIQKPGTIFPRSRLASIISAYGERGNDRSVDVLISRLRRKLKDDPKDQKYIVTVHREGYIFTSQVY